MLQHIHVGELKEKEAGNMNIFQQHTHITQAEGEAIYQTKMY